MSQLTLNITNEKIIGKLLWMLEHFKSDGVEIVNQATKKTEDIEYSDEYMQENWRELVITSGNNSDYYKSEQYYQDRAEDYIKREKI